MSTRSIASIQKIVELNPIPGADLIEHARVLNWLVVVKRDQFTVGETVVFFEIDSFVPHVIAPFLTKHKPQNFCGTEGNRLKTIKIRDAVSQGLVMSIGDLTEFLTEGDLFEGTDVTAKLNVQKWEKPEVTGEEWSGGTLPGFVPKTRQNRIQNIGGKIHSWNMKHGDSWEITEKLEGTSMSVYHNNGEVGICTRSHDTSMTEPSPYRDGDQLDKISEKLKVYGANIVIQGELIGPGVRGNMYGVKTPQLMVFDIYNIDKNEYMTPVERHAIVAQLGLKHVPVINSNAQIQGVSVDDLILTADGLSQLKSVDREGLVFKHNNADLSFKIISNEYLLGEK